MKKFRGFKKLEVGEIVQLGDFVEANGSLWPLSATGYPIQQSHSPHYRKLSPVSGRAERDPKGSLQRVVPRRSGAEKRKQPFNLVCSAPVKRFAALILKYEKLRAKYFRWALRAQKQKDMDGQLIYAAFQMAYTQIQVDLERMIAANSTQRSGGERRKLNADLRQDAVNGRGA